MDELADGFCKQPSSLGSSAREACILAAVQGPGVVALRGVGDNGELLLARAACSLADVLHERGALSDAEVGAVGAAAASALARVHAAGLVHGDVKPANLLLSHDGELWLADFDTACPTGGRPLSRHSPPRPAPGSAARPAADVSALAVTLVELSTGSLIDPGVSWRAGDLRRLGCSPVLSAQISLMLGGAVPGSSALSARQTAELFQHSRAGALPAPAARARQVDLTPTIDFMPARRLTPKPAPAAPPAPGADAASLWSRLAQSWSRKPPANR